VTYVLILSLSLSLSNFISNDNREAIQSVLEDAFESSIGQYDAYLNNLQREKRKANDGSEQESEDESDEMDFETMLSLRRLKGIELTVLENNKDLPYISSLSGM
jgi:hypothetical protein